MGRPYEVLLIDDGSTDGSGEQIDLMAKQAPEIRPVHFAGNAGQSAGFDAGFRLARGAIIVTLDADLQNDPADIPMLVERLEAARAGAVIGVRVGRRDSLVRRVSSRVGNFVRNKLTKDFVTDTGCSLKVYRREALANLKMFTGMHRFLPTLIRIEGFDVQEVPVRHRERKHGTSKYGIGNRALTGLADVLAVRWMRSRALHYRLRGGDGLAGRSDGPARDGKGAVARPPDPQPSSSERG
jgi:glycosyltransferase involved in cell wall biosynthesis